MLILTRRVGECIYIGDPKCPEQEAVKMVVLGLKGHQIRLGFEAPEETGIYRKEIWERIQREQAAKAQAPQPLEEDTHA